MAKINLTEISNREMKKTDHISDCSVKAINPDNSINGKLSHQRSVTMNPEDAASTPTSHSVAKRMKNNISSASIGVINTLRYKVSVIFVVCCIIGCCLIPIIVYSVYQTTDIDGTDTECLNNSSTKVRHVHYRMFS